MAYKLLDRYAVASTTTLLPVGGLTFDVDITPSDPFPAGHTVIATIEDNRDNPTVYEEVLLTALSSNTFTIASGGRGHAGTEQEWPIGSHVSIYVQSEIINGKVDAAGSDFTAKGISAEYHDNGASGAANRANGEACKITLTSAGTVITVTGLSATQRYLLLEIYDADTYAPDISALTPLINEATVTFGKMTRILAEYCGDGVTRFTYLGYSAT